MRTLSFLPTKILIEITNVCNFDCTFCPLGTIERKKKFMELEVVQRLIDEIASSGLGAAMIGGLRLHQLGEPLMHPKVFDIINHANARGIPIGLVTNGSRLTEENLERLSGTMTGLAISYQTPSEESFKSRRARNMSFESYRSIVFNAIDFKFKTKMPNHIHWSILYTDVFDWYKIKALNSGSEVALLKAELDQLGISLGDKYGVPYTVMSDEEFGDRVAKGNPIQFAPGVEVQFKSPYVWPTHKNKRTTEGHCAKPMNELAVFCDGGCSLCCIDDDNAMNIGNIHESSLVDIWYSPKATEIREAFARRQVVHPLCQQCLSPA